MEPHNQTELKGTPIATRDEINLVLGGFSDRLTEHGREFLADKLTVEFASLPTEHLVDAVSGRLSRPESQGFFKQSESEQAAESPDPEPEPNPGSLDFYVKQFQERQDAMRHAPMSGQEVAERQREQERERQRERESEGGPKAGSLEFYVDRFNQARSQF
jgi:hypothetical protein